MEAIRKIDNIELLNRILEDAYTQGYTDAMHEIEEKSRTRRETRKRKLYFLKQRIYGIILLILPIITMKIADGDATIAIFTIPLGIYLLISKEMLIVNNYYWQHQNDA